MLRTVFTKIMWVGRATTFAIGLAVILALTVGVATTATAAKAPTLKLGVQNAVRAVTSMAGTLADPILRLDNNGAGPALDLQVEPGRAPMTVNSDSKVTNLNADKIDGQEASAFLPTNGKAQDAAHADRADLAGSATSATNAQNAANADQLDGQDSTAFLRAARPPMPTSWTARTPACSLSGPTTTTSPSTAATRPAGGASARRSRLRSPRARRTTCRSGLPSPREGTDIQQISYCSGGRGAKPRSQQLVHNPVRSN